MFLCSGNAHDSLTNAAVVTKSREILGGAQGPKQQAIHLHTCTQRLEICPCRNTAINHAAQQLPLLHKAIVSWAQPYRCSENAAFYQQELQVKKLIVCFFFFSETFFIISYVVYCSTFWLQRAAVTGYRKTLIKPCHDGDSLLMVLFSKQSTIANLPIHAFICIAVFLRRNAKNDRKNPGTARPLCRCMCLGVLEWENIIVVHLWGWA